MEDIRQDSITAFDTRFTNNHIRMLKILLPFLDISMQRSIAVYIKFQELQYVLQYFRQPAFRHSQSSTTAKDQKAFDFSAVCDELLPYCSEHEKKQFSSIRNMMDNFHNLKDMMEMMETLKELFPEGMGTGSEGSFNPEMMAAMSNMFGGGNMDFSAMADMFSGKS